MHAVGLCYNCLTSSLEYPQQHKAFFIAQLVKNLPAMQEPWVRKIPLEKEMAPNSIILAWKIPWIEEPGRLQSMGLLGVGHD